MKNEIEDLHIGTKHQDSWSIIFRGNNRFCVSVTPNMGDLRILLEGMPAQFLLLGTNVREFELQEADGHFGIVVNYVTDDGKPTACNASLELGIGDRSLLRMARAFVDTLNWNFYRNRVATV